MGLLERVDGVAVTIALAKEYGAMREHCSKLHSEVRRLQVALEDYGCHYDNCEGCTCGLSDAIAKAKGD